ncbi:MAG: hypothetical protein L0I93_06615, partial [Atopostipes suicloacalis]|nr:hypothetical protein [Atopostipes suicloacalis]
DFIMKYNIEYSDKKPLEIDISYIYQDTNDITILVQEQEYGKVELIRSNEHSVYINVPVRSKIDYQIELDTELSKEDKIVLADVSGDPDEKVTVKTNMTVIVENSVVISANVDKSGFVINYDYHIEYAQIIENVDINLYTDPYDLDLAEELYEKDIDTINEISKNQFVDNAQNNIDMKLVIE